MTGWKPDSKVVAAAIAALVAGALQVWAGLDVFPGFEAALAVVIAYLVPSTASKPIDDRPEDG